MAAAPIDKQLANILQGDWRLDLMDHEGKVVTLACLYELWSSTLAAGWHQHTGDWDWQCDVVTATRTYTSINTCFAIQWEVLPDKGPPHTACVEAPRVRYVKHDHEYFIGDELQEEVGVKILIDDITKVRFEQL